MDICADDFTNKNMYDYCHAEDLQKLRKAHIDCKYAPHNALISKGLSKKCCKAKKKNMCVSDFPTDSPFSRRPTQVFLLCDSKFFYWGSYRKKNEVNRTTLREVMRVWRQNFLKWVQILNIWREISLQDNNKIFHSFFEYRLCFFIVRLKVFFIEDHI